MKYAKWIGGGLGWAFGGPIGALIGFALGSLFDSDDRPAGQRRQTAAGDFKMSLLVLIACIIKADGTVKASELETVRRILVANFGRQEADEAMRILDRLRIDFDAIRAPYTKRNDSSWAYKALGIEPSATDDEIKSAYRKMAMKYHPDKLAGLGEDVKKAGEEKFRAVKDAYDHLKKERGIK